MRLLADENFPGEAVISLLTFDKDFGELAFRFGLSTGSGIVLFRMVLSSPAAVAEKATLVPESREDWAGHFSVIEEHRLRMVPLPAS